jgi:CubicO group peptidase (beta-lactamase class C family)
VAGLTAIGARFGEALARLDEVGVGGAVAAVDVGGQRLVRSAGIANLNTGQPFTDDTGWLLGSVTKVLVATTLMRLVERGAVELDARARRYVPEFALRDADAADAITVRMLVNHTNGMDADALRPVGVRGHGASRSYTEALANMGVLFEPGAGIHYTNPGFVVAARVIEEASGLAFEDAIERELFEPAGMERATQIHTKAFLHRTAVGAHAASAGRLHATKLFALAESGSGAGSTTVVTVDDMLSFGRMHLDGGVAPNGRRLLSSESVASMQTTTFDLGIPQAPPIGLGWWLFPIAGTIVPWHGGGSPGGSSCFCILPEHDATIVSFATGPGGAALHTLIHDGAIEELTGRPPAAPFAPSAVAAPSGLAGEYASFQKRVHVEVGGDELVLTDRFAPYDDVHLRNHIAYGGSQPAPVTTRYVGVGPGQFAPRGADPRSFGSFYGRLALLAALPAGRGRRPGLHTGLRFTPRLS